MSAGLKTELSPVWTGLLRCVMTCLMSHLIGPRSSLILILQRNQFKKKATMFLPQYPELLVASYNNNEDAPHEPDGVALVWNLKYKKGTPEYIFHCQVRTEHAHSFPTDRRPTKTNPLARSFNQRQTHFTSCSSSRR